jgi:hypothetical protein
MPKRARSKLLLRYGTYCVLTESHLIRKSFKIWQCSLLHVITFSVDTMMAEGTALLHYGVRGSNIDTDNDCPYLFLRISLFPPGKCENSNLIRPISFAIPYHTVIIHYPVRGHDHAVNYKPQHKICLFNGYIVAKYRLLTAVMLKIQISGILRCVGEQVVTEVS